MARTFPTYETPQGPVRDFIRYLAEDTEPPRDEPFDQAIARARQTIANGEDPLCDMGDGSGPRLASEILEDIANPEIWAPLLAKINQNIERAMMGQEAVQWPKQP